MNRFIITFFDIEKKIMDPFVIDLFSPAHVQKTVGSMPRLERQRFEKQVYV